MKEVKDFLISNKDTKYQDFSENLNICKGYRSIGVRIPRIRDYAKTLSKEYPIDYLLKNIDEEYYEEILLKGFIIGNYNDLTYDKLVFYIDNHLTKIRDWSMCDTFAASLKITKKYQKELWDYINIKLKSKEEFVVRFALVVILNYYICDEYIARIFDVIRNITLDDYYVKMANAWLISYMFINYFDDTIKFIKSSNLDTWTLKKGITKAIESFRLSDEQKRTLRKIRDNVKEKE